jgi:hypothetical protein
MIELTARGHSSYSLLAMKSCLPFCSVPAQRCTRGAATRTARWAAATPEPRSTRPCSSTRSYRFRNRFRFLLGLLSMLAWACLVVFTPLRVPLHGFSRLRCLLAETQRSMCAIFHQNHLLRFDCDLTLFAARGAGRGLQFLDRIDDQRRALGLGIAHGIAVAWLIVRVLRFSTCASFCDAAC